MRRRAGRQHREVPGYVLARRHPVLLFGALAAHMMKSP
jgi:hypothetical protein